MEDVLRIGGQYDSAKYSRAATVTTNTTPLCSVEAVKEVIGLRFLFVDGKFTGGLFLVCLPGLLLHQVVDTEKATGQPALRSTGRHQQTQVGSALFAQN